MKTLKYILPLFFLVLACEESIEVDLDTENPRLVIDASINWKKGTSGSEQSIKLTLTSPYFSNEVSPANNAIVSITDQNSNTFSFIEEGTSGIYSCDNFNCSIGTTYFLNILYQDEIYTAQETFTAVSSFDFIEQFEGAGFSGEDYEVKAYFTDPEDETNFYFFEFNSDALSIPELGVYEDRFTNGNQMFGYFSDEEVTQGNNLIIRNYGVSESFYNYMFVLLQQNNSEGGGPFETQPATVRGNCINQTSSNNYPLGFFRLSEVDEAIYTIE